MIQITHKQAQRFIREALDTTLPGEQWAVLQGHLETCPDCRAYQARLQNSETSLRRLTRSRWANAGGPQVPTYIGVQRYRQQRVERGRLARRAAAFLGVAVLLFILLRVRAAAQPRPEPVAPPATAGPSPTPGQRINPDAFQGVVVFSAQRTAGESLDGDLFMLTAGPQGADVQPLTSGPANDTDPVWSPDGNWIAFLSNQDRLQEDPPRQDIYVMSVAGTHLTRLTNDPDYVLYGPLSWSADGQWLAAGAFDRRSQKSVIYLVPVGRNALDDPGGRALPGEPFDMTNPQFSPQGARLAYFASGGDLTTPEISQLDLKTSLMSIRASTDPAKSEHLTGLFDWGWNGTSLAYMVRGQNFELRTTENWAVFSPDTLNPQNGLLWGPDRNLIYRLNRQVGQYSCSLLVAEGQAVPDRIEPGLFAQPTSTPLAPFETPPDAPLSKQPHLLCLSGPGLDRSAWGHQYKKDWLVVTGWTETALQAAPTAAPGDPNFKEPASAIYAIPYPLAQPLGGNWQKLADLPEGYIPGRLAVRPNGAQAEINPVAAQKEAVSAYPGSAAQPGQAGLQQATAPAKPGGDAQTPAALQGSDLPPAGQLARLVGISRDGQMLRLSADEHGLKANLTETKAADANASYSAAMLSPNGQQVAVIYTYSGWRSEVFTYPVAALQHGQVIEAGSLLQVTSRARRTYRPEAAWVYDRLAWSPDGKRIAALMHVTGENAAEYALQIINLEQSSQGSMVSLGRRLLPDGAHPAWTPDGREVLLPVNQNPAETAGVISVNAADGTIRRVTESDGYDIVPDAAVAPDGSAVAYFALTTYPLRMDPPHDALFQLRVAGLALESFIQPLSLPGYDPEVPNTGYGWLQWRTDGEGNKHLMFLRRNGPLAFAKTAVYDFPLPKTSAVVAPATLSTLYQIRDEVVSAAWSPDGKWLIYSTQAGTFLLDLRVDGKATEPVFLAPIVCTGLDWK